MKNKKFIFITLLTIIALINGVFLSENLSNQVKDLLQSYLKNIEFSIPGIFINNIKASLIILLSGFLLSFIGVFLYYFNILLLGVFLKSVSLEKSIIYFFISILPHGIFELPAIVFSLYLCLSLTEVIFFRIDLSINEKLHLLKQILIKYLKVVPLLLLIAATIECYMTPYIVKVIFG